MIAPRSPRQMSAFACRGPCPWQKWGEEPSQLIDGPKGRLGFNHVHLYDVVEPYADAQLPQLEALGRQLAQLWRDVVATRYPEHGITVTFATEPDEYGPTLFL